jgi:5-formyltetrahydrofolate cyclo-ligase
MPKMSSWRQKSWTIIFFHVNISKNYQVIIKSYSVTLPLKTVLRKQVAQARDGLSREARKSKSREIGERLFALPEFRAAGVVMFFASFRSEVDTLTMIRHALAAGKRVFLPKVKGRELALFEIRDFDKDTVPGAWSIPEPRETLPAAIREVDLMIVPGLAFDENGNRLGYGAGFYDRILPSFPRTTVALAFEEQIVPAVPVSNHDIPVKKIITEKRIIEVK